MPTAPLPAAPLINGRRYSYSSMEFNFIAGTFIGRVVDIDEINYSEKLTIGYRRGTSKIPLGSTVGVWEPQEGSLSIGKSTWTQLIANMGPWLGINFVLNVNYNDQGEPLTTEVITGRFTGQANENAYGPDALHTTITFEQQLPTVTNNVPSLLP